MRDQFALRSYPSETILKTADKETIGFSFDLVCSDGNYSLWARGRNVAHRNKRARRQ